MNWSKMLSLVAGAVVLAGVAGFEQQAQAAWPDGKGPLKEGQSWWEKAANSPAYTKASAHEPMFGDKSLWPQLTGKEQFPKESWPKARVLVWANPGQSGFWHPKKAGLDPTDPKHWLEDGKPCTKLVLDENTDLVFPASETPYSVGFRASPVREICRHLTIEKGAKFVGGGDGAGRMIYGNVWVKKGGSMYAQGSTRFPGGKHTFYRNDNYRTNCSQYFTFDKDSPELTVEFLGFASTSDEWRLNKGTVIVGVDSWMQPGRAATPFIAKDGTLVLLDGAYWGKWCNELGGSVDLISKGGTIQAGLPDRPLTRDCWLALSVRNWAGLDFSKWPNDRLKKRTVSAIFENGSTIRTVVAPGAKASLIVTRYELDDLRGRSNGYFHGVGSYSVEADKSKGLFTDAEFLKLFTSKPHKTVAWLGRDVTIEGSVQFDHFAPGGILYADEATRKRWQVTLGSGNQGQPQELFRQLDKLNRDGSY